ncbi:MAG: hypothetical protein B7733_21520 [Myxococcales bacterium FL481]|nr:MAG: hypothetical protein B7733_21520 [Myxococcales bacterium FL481]
MTSYTDGSVKAFWLLSQNQTQAPASQSDAAAWHSNDELGLGNSEHTFTLVDGQQDGFSALFPDRPGTDGSMVFTYGTVISAMDEKDFAGEIEDAL